LIARWTGAHEPVDVSRLERRLPPVLSVIAGMVDAIGFLSLGLFTAHVTGNLVVIAAQLLRGGPPHLAQILAVPVFMMAVAAAWLIQQPMASAGRWLTALRLLSYHLPVNLVC
jgi:uncharacterized membrane protein YoaK (UPF0700 family)